MKRERPNATTEYVTGPGAFRHRADGSEKVKNKVETETIKLRTDVMLDAAQKTRICPILAVANFPQLAVCMRQECALWNARNECCGLICPVTGR